MELFATFKVIVQSFNYDSVNPSHNHNYESPDYIIIQHRMDVAEAAVKDKESSKVWNSLEAVKNNHVGYL